MSTMKIKPDELSKVMDKLLDQYGDEVYDAVESIAKDKARKATSELRRVSPGDFAKKWRHGAKKTPRVKYTETIYNQKYQLAHLLEKPHKTGPKRGGQYPRAGGPDYTGNIAKVEEKYSKEYLEELTRRL